MADREKVIKGLERCFVDECSKCPYVDGPYCKAIPKDGKANIEVPTGLANDALELLKVQEPLAVRVIDDFGAIKFGYCPTCGSIINNRGYPKSCGCGQAVKWDE